MKQHQRSKNKTEASLPLWVFAKDIIAFRIHVTYVSLHDIRRSQGVCAHEFLCSIRSCATRLSLPCSIVQHCAGSRSERVHEWKGCHSSACGLGDRHTRAPANYLPSSDAILWLERFVGVKKKVANPAYKTSSVKIIGYNGRKCSVANICDILRKFCFYLLAYLFKNAAC